MTPEHTHCCHDMMSRLAFALLANIEMWPCDVMPFAKNWLT